MWMLNRIDTVFMGTVASVKFWTGDITVTSRPKTGYNF